MSSTSTGQFFASVNRRVFTLLVFLLISTPFIAGGPGYGKIVLYRPEPFRGSNFAQKIYLNDSLIVTLHNQTYYEIAVPPGYYALRIGHDRYNVFRVDVEAGQTYFLKFRHRTTGLFSSRPVLERMDNRIADAEIRARLLKPLDGTNKPLRWHRFHIGALLGGGSGREAYTFLKSNKGDEYKISFGGGRYYGAFLGYEFNSYFDLSASLRIQKSELDPEIHGIRVEFKRSILSLSPSLTIPFNGGFTSRIKVGAGLDYYFNNVLLIRCSSVIPGFDDDAKYGDSGGYSGSLSYEVDLASYLSMNVGVRIYQVNYVFSSSKLAYYVGDPFQNVNGSGTDFVFGVSLKF